MALKDMLAVFNALDRRAGSNRDNTIAYHEKLATAHRTRRSKSNEDRRRSLINAAAHLLHVVKLKNTPDF